MDETGIKKYAVDELPNFYDYLRSQSVSVKGQGITETADWLVAKFQELGAARVEKWHDQGGNPVVFADFKGHSDKTLLFYNHYDVQPAEPLSEWESDPFEPTERDGKLYARGVADDKGELISRLTLVKYFNEHGGLPVNLKFYVEGEEEVGSPKVGEYVKAHQADLQADAIIWEGGGLDEAENFQVACGLKGISCFNLHVTTASGDLHSSLAVYADNAAWRLTQALASLRSADNRIQVTGFYDDIQELSETGLKALNAMSFDPDDVRGNYGLTTPFVSDNPKYDLVNGTTMTINGLFSGYEGDGVKTIVPREATAKIDCRLVPDQDPEKIAAAVKAQLAANGFGDVELEYVLGQKPFRTDLDSPFVQLNVAVAREVYGEAHTKLIPNMAGTGPAYKIGGQLGLPIVMVGVHYAGSHPHSPNENIRLVDYAKGTYFLGTLLERFGEDA